MYTRSNISVINKAFCGGFCAKITYNLLLVFPLSIVNYFSFPFLFNSLVELCSLGGLDLPPSDGIGSKDDENWMSKRTISISSDVSALSSVTLLGMDELECLLNDVKALEDDALEVLGII